MNFGQGAITFVNKPPVIPPPPVVPVLSMQNGLSLIGTAGELGLNPLLHDTTIPTDAFLWQVGDFNLFGNQSSLIIDDANNNITANMRGGRRMWLFDDGFADHYIFGDFDNISSGAQLFIAGNGVGFPAEYALKDIMGDYLRLSPLASNYAMGDLSSLLNKSFINIDDANKAFWFNTGDAGFKYLNLDVANAVYKIGDIDIGNNGTQFNIDDINKLFFFECATSGSKFDLVNTIFIFDGDGGTALYANLSGIITSPPTGGGATGQWQLGKEIVAGVAFDATKYLEVSVDGTLYKIALAT
jgi:hypothetical protein